MRCISTQALFPRSICLLAALVCCTVGAAATADEIGEGWLPLFDGKSLQGWKASEQAETWRVQDGCLVASGDRSLLFYEGPVGNHDFRNFELIAEDFAQVKPLLIYPHAGNAIHTRNRAVNSMADLRGMKLRTPSRTGAWLIEAWGAEPVGMPVPELPQALSRGAVDGALVPFEIFMPYSLHELTSFSIEGPGHGRFGASVFVFAMNLDRYNALPDDLKAVIDANSGTNIAEWVGQVWDDIEGPGRSAQEGTGATMIELTPEAMAEFDTAAEAVTARWVAEATSRGVDGQALVDAARAAVQAEMQ